MLANTAQPAAAASAHYSQAAGYSDVALPSSHPSSSTPSSASVSSVATTSAPLDLYGSGGGVGVAPSHPPSVPLHPLVPFHPSRPSTERMLVKLTVNLMHTYNAINERYYANK